VQLSDAHSCKYSDNGSGQKDSRPGGLSNPHGQCQSGCENEGDEWREASEQRHGKEDQSAAGCGGEDLQGEWNFNDSEFPGGRSAEAQFAGIVLLDQRLSAGFDGGADRRREC
jgi:hypothetical protein